MQPTRQRLQDFLDAHPARLSPGGCRAAPGRRRACSCRRGRGVVHAHEAQAAALPAATADARPSCRPASPHCRHPRARVQTAGGRQGGVPGVGRLPRGDSPHRAEPGHPAQPRVRQHHTLQGGAGGGGCSTPCSSVQHSSGFGRAGPRRAAHASPASPVHVQRPDRRPRPAPPLWPPRTTAATRASTPPSSRPAAAARRRRSGRSRWAPARRRGRGAPTRACALRHPRQPPQPPNPPIALLSPQYAACPLPRLTHPLRRPPPLSASTATPPS
jgi:hypothetical protein